MSWLYLMLSRNEASKGILYYPADLGADAQSNQLQVVLCIDCINLRVMTFFFQNLETLLGFLTHPHTGFGTLELMIFHPALRSLISKVLSGPMPNSARSETQFRDGGFSYGECELTKGMMVEISRK